MDDVQLHVNYLLRARITYIRARIIHIRVCIIIARIMHITTYIRLRNITSYERSIYSSRVITISSTTRVVP